MPVPKLLGVQALLMPVCFKEAADVFYFPTFPNGLQPAPGDGVKAVVGSRQATGDAAGGVGVLTPVDHAHQRQITFFQGSV